MSRAAERVDRVADLPLGEAAHLGDHAGQLLEVGVEGLDGVLARSSDPLVLGRAATAQASAEAAGDVVLGALVARAW